MVCRASKGYSAGLTGLYLLTMLGRLRQKTGLSRSAGGGTCRAGGVPYPSGRLEDSHDACRRPAP